MGIFLKVKYLILLNISSVFPTFVGMFLLVLVLEMYNLCLPHARGDVPLLVYNVGELTRYDYTCKVNDNERRF